MVVGTIQPAAESVGFITISPNPVDLLETMSGMICKPIGKLLGWNMLSKPSSVFTPFIEVGQAIRSSTN